MAKCTSAMDTANARVHKYSPDGELIKIVGATRYRSQRVRPTALRQGRSAQQTHGCGSRETIVSSFFTLDGEYIEEWGDLLQPDTIYIDEDDLVYIAELGQRISIMTLDGEVISQWGSERGSSVPWRVHGVSHTVSGWIRTVIYTSVRFKQMHACRNLSGKR